MADLTLRSSPQRTAPSRLARIVGARSHAQTKRALWGYVFALPWIIGLAAFTVGPILASFLLSFTEYNVMSPPKFVGLANYVKAVTSDDQFWPSIGRTFAYALGVVPLGIVGSLLLAMGLNRSARGVSVYRMLFYLPSLTPAVALALLWTWLFDPTVGPIDVVLDYVGIPGPGWLADPHWALSALVIIALWGSIGGNTMLIFLAGLKGVPKELHDAAEIDGAGRWARFRNVTLPMISPTMLFNLILGVIGALKVFTISFVATNGGPSYATWFFALHIYQEAFRYFQMGYGSALSWLFLIMLLAFTYLQLVYARRWVYYAGGKD